MPELLKNYYNLDLFQKLADDLKRIDATFDARGFVQSGKEKSFLALELKDRMHYIADKLYSTMHGDFSEKVANLSRIVSNYSGLQGMIFPDFIERFGIGYSEVSIPALKVFTSYSSAEFAIRPFLIHYPNTIHTFYEWMLDDNFHVRRLASEGCRPLLPWAQKLPSFIKDPTPILPILNHLKDDKEDYVYRSVANNLNDISKHHPELSIELASNWINSSKSANWAAKHAMRTLLKKGNNSVMTMFGFSPSKDIKIIHFSIKDKSLKIGESSELMIKLHNCGKQEPFRIEYSIDYLKKNGKHSAKVFHVTEKTLTENETLEVNRKLNFKNLSTRKHYAGSHFITLIINGNRLNKIPFELC